jgi:hypothetical protein
MKEETGDTIECGNCGALIPLTAKRCPMCGVILYDDLKSLDDDERGASHPQRPQRQAPQRDYQPSSPRHTHTPRPLSADEISDMASPVFIVDFNMPFWSLVVLMVKIALAAIPAMLILAIIGIIFWGILGTTLSAFFR